MPSKPLKHPEMPGQIQTLLQGHGATAFDDLYDALGHEKQGMTRIPLSQIIRHMEDNGLVKRDGDMVWWIGETAAPPSNPNGVRGYQDDASNVQRIRKQVVDAPPSIRQPRKIELPDYQKGRQGHMVTMETAPDEYANVVQLQIQVGDQWFNMPMDGDVRICIGSRVPKWTPAQEQNTNIRAIRFVYSDGSFDVVEGINPNDPVVIAHA